MLTTPKKKLHNNPPTTKLDIDCFPETSMDTNTTSVVFENGTIFGAVTETPDTGSTKQHFIIPQIIISSSNSSSSLNSRSGNLEDQSDHHESTALLESTEKQQNDQFEEFVLNRSTSDSNILDSSIYSELQLPPQPPMAIADILNSSTCSRESRQSKRSHRKAKKCGIVTSSASPANGAMGQSAYPPRYTAIFLDQSHHHQQSGLLHHPNATNAMGQIASAGASSPFLAADQYQYHQFHHTQATVAPGLSGLLHRSAVDNSGGVISAPGNPLGTVVASTAAGSTIIGGVGGAIVPNTGTITQPTRGCFRKWFSRPSLPLVIGILALGGVACTLGGIVLGSTGLIEHSTQYLSAALLMIGIGVSLLVISGAIWRLSIPDDVDECPCYRHMEACRSCNSPYCNNRLLPGSYHLYPEFQHRPPPPSYLTSLNECAAMGLLFHPVAQPQSFNTLRVNTPPPLYRSTNSLSVFMPNSNTGTANITAVPMTNSGSLLPEHNTLTMSALMENLQAAQASQPLTKEITYLELD